MFQKLSSITSFKQVILAGLVIAQFSASLSVLANPATTLRTAPNSNSNSNSKATKPASVTPSGSTNAVAPLALPGSQSWTGYLVDRSCAAAIKGDNKDALKSVKEHTRACSLEPSCCEAGYTVYSQGQWLDLDNGSSQMAKKLMQASKRDKAHVVKVIGVIKRGEVRASSIVEVN